MQRIQLSVAVLCFVSFASGCATTSRILRPSPAPTLIPRAEASRVAYVPPRPAPQPSIAAKASAPPGWVPPNGVKPGLWQCIVVHHSATATGGAAAFDRHHRVINHWDELGYHFVIGNGTDTPDGKIEVGSRWTKQKWGAHCKVPGNYYNDHGIGICLVGNFQERGPSAAQMASLTNLVNFLMRECRIGADKVVSHGGVTGKTACPGRLFPMGQLKSRLNGYATASSLH